MPTLPLILALCTALATLPLMQYLDQREARLRRIKARLDRSTNMHNPPGTLPL